MIASVASAAATAAYRKTRSPSGGTGAAVRYGMTMWFQVEVAGVGAGNLGRWSSCTGLGVDLGWEKVKEGAVHDRRRLLPLTVTYPRVTLERAVASADSARVREWLATVATAWINSDDGGAPAPAAGGYRGTSVTIRLYSAVRGSTTNANDHLVAEWELHDAYPVSWTGPSLNARSGGDVATEKLSFEHNGFLPRDARSAAGDDDQPTGGTLQLKEQGNEARALALQFHPDRIRMAKSVQARSTGPARVVVAEQITDPGKLNITFSTLVEGRTAVAAARTLLYEWLRGRPKTSGGAAPGSSPAPDAKPEHQSTHLDLRIGTGDGAIEHTVILRGVDTSFTRFAASGVPSRAEFGLTLEAVDQGDAAAGGGGTTGPLTRSSATLSAARP